MKGITSILIILLLVPLISIKAQAQRSKINSETYYKALASNDINLIDNELSTLAKLDTSDSGGFSGALIMKKANFEKPLAEKLESFKKGRALLENAISKNPENPEFCFLRLTIQENCPEFLKYNDQIKVDSKRIVEGFNGLLPEIKNAIIDYSKTSKNLQFNKLNPN